MLETMSFEVTLAGSAREGLAELTQADSGDPFHVVLMHWVMPEMEGLKAAQVIRESIPLQQPPKVILVTAYGNELASDQAERAGLLGVLAKPISNSSLFDGIEIAGGAVLELDGPRAPAPPTRPPRSAAPCADGRRSGGR